MLMRTPSTPAANSASITLESREAGPMVASIFARFKMDLSKKCSALVRVFLRVLCVSVVNSCPHLDSPRRHGEHGEQKTLQIRPPLKREKALRPELCGHRLRTPRRMLRAKAFLRCARAPPYRWRIR